MDDRLNVLERVIMTLAPRWAANRARARLLARHFESASFGRRTDGWSRRGTDANSAAAGALGLLRAQARDLVRNNPWARRGLKRIVTDTVGWGIRPKATGASAARVMERFKGWGETTDCDAAGRMTFFGLQKLVMRTVVESGEVLVRRRFRRTTDGLDVNLQLQVLEPDYLDSSRDRMIGITGGPIIQGIEFDQIGNRVAYWLFPQHPGGLGPNTMPVSQRISAENILHIYDLERPGQIRGTSWFASTDVRLHDFAEFEDATLVKQKIAACMAAFVTDLDGDNPPLAEPSTDTVSQKPVDTFEPGMIIPLPEGKQVTVTNPPASNDFQSFSATALRGVAAGLGTTYEDLTGDYSQVNYSSARMARLAHGGDVEDWRCNMLIPLFCAPAWSWMNQALMLEGAISEDLPATWTPPPAQLLDPEKEGQAFRRMVRAGQMTLSQMIAAQGYDPTEFLDEYAADNARLDKLKIILDSDPRKMTDAGMAQVLPGAPAAASPPSAANGVAKKPTAEQAS